MTGKKLSDAVIQAWLEDWNSLPNEERNKIHAEAMRRVRSDFSASFGSDGSEDSDEENASIDIMYVRDLTGDDVHLIEETYSDGRVIVRTKLAHDVMMAAHHGAPAKKSEPPAGPGILITFLMTERHRETLLGDLEEQFNRDRALYGERRATIYYWVSTARSFAPLVLRWLRHARAIALFEAARRYLLG